MMQAQMIHKRQKAKMMKDIAQGTIDIEKTEVGRVRGKLQKLMAKHMDGNPAFKRRVEDFKKLMNSSKKDEQLLQSLGFAFEVGVVLSETLSDIVTSLDLSTPPLSPAVRLATSLSCISASITSCIASSFAFLISIVLLLSIFDSFRF
jgi:hypothetical protein